MANLNKELSQRFSQLLVSSGRLLEDIASDPLANVVVPNTQLPSQRGLQQQQQQLLLQQEKLQQQRKNPKGQQQGQKNVMEKTIEPLAGSNAAQLELSIKSINRILDLMVVNLNDANEFVENEKKKLEEKKIKEEGSNKQSFEVDVNSLELPKSLQSPPKIIQNNNSNVPISTQPVINSNNNINNTNNNNTNNNNNNTTNNNDNNTSINNNNNINSNNNKVNNNQVNTQFNSQVDSQLNTAHIVNNINNDNQVNNQANNQNNNQNNNQIYFNQPINSNNNQNSSKDNNDLGNDLNFLNLDFNGSEFDLPNTGESNFLGPANNNGTLDEGDTNNLLNLLQDMIQEKEG